MLDVCKLTRKSNASLELQNILNFVEALLILYDTQQLTKNLIFMRHQVDVSDENNAKALLVRKLTK